MIGEDYLISIPNKYFKKLSRSENLLKYNNPVAALRQHQYYKMRENLHFCVRSFLSAPIQCAATSRVKKNMSCQPSKGVNLSSYLCEDPRVFAAWLVPSNSWLLKQRLLTTHHPFVSSTSILQWWNRQSRSSMNSLGNIFFALLKGHNHVIFVLSLSNCTRAKMWTWKSYVNQLSCYWDRAIQRLTFPRIASKGTRVVKSQIFIFHKLHNTLKLMVPISKNQSFFSLPEAALSD